MEKKNPVMIFDHLQGRPCTCGPLTIRRGPVVLLKQHASRVQDVREDSVIQRLR